MFLSISPVHLCFDLFLSCFPINYLLSFRPLGPAMASSHITLGWGVGHSNWKQSASSQLQSSSVPLGVYILDPHSIFPSSLGEWVSPHTLSLPVTNQIIRSPNLFKLSSSIPQPKKSVYHSTRPHGGHTHLVWTVTVFQMVGLRMYPIKGIVRDEILRRNDSPVEDLAGGISPSSIL